MFYGASPLIFKMAKDLRKNLTEAEKELWEKLNRKQLGVKFRRQHPISNYIADFYSHEIRLVIEIDGDYHLKKDQKTLDELRTDDMIALGIKVIRFKNEEVLNDMLHVIEEIRKAIYRGISKP